VTFLRFLTLFIIPGTFFSSMISTTYTSMCWRTSINYPDSHHCTKCYVSPLLTVYQLPLVHICNHLHITFGGWFICKYEYGGFLHTFSRYWVYCMFYCTNPAFGCYIL